MVKIPGIPTKKMKNCLPTEFMKVILYLRLLPRRISISGLLGIFQRIRNGDLQILERMLQRVINQMNIHPYQSIVVGFFTFRGFVTTVRILAVWLHALEKLSIKGKRMELF